jgi:magnesium chelatase subunit D
MDGRQNKELYGTRVESKSEKGKYVKSRVSHNISSDIAIDATLRAAAIHCQGKFNVEKEDLREKIRKHKARASIVMIVDMSGSMVSHKKINKIKNILNLVIKNINKNKDKLSVIGFKGKDSEVIIPNTKHPKSFLHKLDTITVGGTTPMAIGLLKGLNILKKDIEPKAYVPLIMILSDGMPNVGLNGNPIKDTLSVGKEIAKNNIHTIVIDFDKKYGQGINVNMELAFLTKGRYYDLENVVNPHIAIDKILNHERSIL